MLFVEWSPMPTHSLVFTRPEELPATGFRTYFQFDEQAVEELKQQGNASGMNRFIAHADSVFIDIDNNPDAVTAFRQHFRQQGTSYSMWESGGKGTHFHIPTDLLSNSKLPAIHANYIKSVGIPCDTSLYRHNSLFRLPGTVHKKTKKIKRLLEIFQGQTLVIPEKCFEVTTVAPKQLERNYDDLTGALMQWIHLRLNEPQEGCRYMSLWSAADALLRSGLSEDSTTELLEVLNEGWENPKETEEVERAIRDALRSANTQVDRERPT